MNGTRMRFHVNMSFVVHLVVGEKKKKKENTTLNHFFTVLHNNATIHCSLCPIIFNKNWVYQRAGKQRNEACRGKATGIHHCKTNIMAAADESK